MVEMAMVGMQTLLLAIILSCVMLMPITGAAAATSSFKCPSAFWIFGDSLTDTGNSQATFPSLSHLFPPYGESYTFQDKPGINRYSNGRLIVDFVAQAFDYDPFFGTYAHVLNGANYKRGTNFAYSGATANSTTFITPFYLNLQVDQFLNFKNVTLNPASFPRGLYLPVPNAFSQGAYYIPEIGGNDFFVASVVLMLPAPAVIRDFVPPAAAAVKTAITTLHDSGARLFFLGNTPPQGCNPAQLTIFAGHPRDSLGCVDDINSINQAYAAALQHVVTQLQASFGSDGTQIYYFDFYNATIEILTNPTTYGFTNTYQSCCGVGGPYNYDSAFSGCAGVGSCCFGSTACGTPASYVHWDGIHYTQAFYKQITKFFLEGRFVTPTLNLKAACSLDYNDF